MYQNNHRIVIIWSGVINNLSVLNDERIQIFQNIGVDDVQAVISSLDFEHISAVIGAPGIAAEIRRLIPVPLIIAYPNYIDVLETVKDVELKMKLEYKKIALILHESNKIQEDRLDYFIHNTITLYKYSSREHIQQILQRIIDKDYALVIGGPTVVSMASRYKLNAVQLIYREQALLDALEKTHEILSLMSKEVRQFERLKAVLDVIPDGIIETDEQGTIEMCNRNTLKMLALSYDQVLGKNVCALLGDAVWEKVYTNKVSQTDRLFTYKNTKYFSTRLPIVENKRLIGSVGTIQEAAKIENMERKYRSHQNQGMTASYTFDDIIGESFLMREVIERAKIYTQCDTTILLEGETGTGKEIFAQSIHNESPRRNGPFVAINCAALPEPLLESELMGYDEGAFTGARKGGKIGMVERAHKGTLFLDEVNQLPLPLQAKLLRIIQEKSVMHLGGDSIIPVDVRIIAAANEQLRVKTAEGSFRSDLYYRLNVLNISLPPLRERREDIPGLMATFAAKFEKDKKLAARHVDSMLSLAAGHDWPGNIRELQNFVERFLILSGRVSQLDKYFFHEFRKTGPLVESRPEKDKGNSLSIRLDTLENMEAELIRGVVEHCGGNKSKAALLMDISRNTIHQRMKNSSRTPSDAAGQSPKPQ